MKTCVKCKNEMPDDHFVNRGGRIGSACKVCISMRTELNRARSYIISGGDLDAKKRCCTCRKLIGRYMFGVSRGVDGLRPQCRSCKAEATAKYRVQNGDRLRESGRQYVSKNREKISRKQAGFFYKDAYLCRNFGITAVDYNDMLVAQSGLCLICGKPERSGRFKNLAVDHDHETGVVRGLLCSHCNRGIGLFGDNPDVLRNAAKYIEDKKS